VTTDLFKVDCLTPVHIGSGDELLRGIDFYSEGGFTEVLDPELVLRNLSGLEGFAETVQRGGDIREFFKSRRINAESCRLYRVRGLIEAQKLRMAIRAGDGRPMIPGSSLKGAIRTLLLAAWTGEGAPHTGARPAPVREALSHLLSGRPSQRLEEAVFHFSRDGLRPDDPRTDVLRTLSISDATFAPATLNVVSSIAVGTRRTTLTAAEALEPAASALLTLKLGNSFLASQLPFTNKVPDLGTLARWSHQHARHLILADVDFFKNLDEPSMVERLEGLVAEIDKAAADAIVLRLGWGTGWRTMTGDILTPDERGQVLRRVGKTRKAIIDAHSGRGRPCDIFGWVRIQPIGVEEAMKLAALTRPLRQEPETRPPGVPVQQTTQQPLPPPPDPFDSRVADFKARDWGRVRALYQQAVSAPHVNERERRLRLLATKLEEIFRRDRKRLLEIGRLEALAPYLKQK